MIGSVWGPSSGRNTPPLTSSLARQFDKIGLDGQICAEYILSLLEMYKTPGDRSAAISDFVMDSIASVTSLKQSQHYSFVSEVLEIVSRNGSLPPASRQVPPPPAPSSQESVLTPQESSAQVPKKGFKKGTKLTGMALKQVVGNVKPSFVQRYSDDESEQVSSVRVPISTGPVIRTISSASQHRAAVDSHYFPSLEVKSSGSSSVSNDRVSPPETPHMHTPAVPVKGKKKTSRKSGAAREIGPDEAWSGDDDGGDGDSDEFKTPFTSVKEKKLEQTMDKRKTLSVTGFNSVKISPPKRVDSPGPVMVTKKVETPQPVQVIQRIETAPVEKQLEAKMLPQNEVEVVKPTPVKIVSILDTTPPPAVMEPSLLIPSDILSFDFQFEGEEEEKEIAPETETFDLLRQMFGGLGGLTPSPPIVVAPPTQPTAMTAAAESASDNTDLSQRKYSSNYLLRVLSSMGQEGVEKPAELQALCVQGEEPKRRSPHGDLNGGSWRSNGDQVTRNKNWKASGYDKHTEHKEQTKVVEEGFW